MTRQTFCLLFVSILKKSVLVDVSPAHGITPASLLLLFEGVWGLPCLFCLTFPAPRANNNSLVRGTDICPCTVLWHLQKSWWRSMLLLWCGLCCKKWSKFPCIDKASGCPCTLTRCKPALYAAPHAGVCVKVLCHHPALILPSSKSDFPAGIDCIQAGVSPT